MRAVQFAQQFAEHLAQFAVVADIGKETAVVGREGFEVHTVIVGVAETAEYLVDAVVEDVFPFFLGLSFSLRSERQVFDTPVGQGNLAQGTVADIDSLAFLVRLEVSAAQVLAYYSCGVVLQVVYPQVVASLEGRQIIQFQSVGREVHASEVGGIDGKASDALVTVPEVQFQCLDTVCLGGGRIFSLVLTVFLVLGTFLFVVLFRFGILRILLPVFLVSGIRFLSGFIEFPVFFVEFGEFVSLFVEEHHVDIVLRAPAAVAAVACAVGGPDNGFAAEGPLRSAVGIAAVREVHDFLAVGADGRDVHAVPTVLSHVRGEEPTAVRRPLEIHVAVGIREIVFGRQGHVDGFALHVVHANLRAVGQEGNLLAVGRIFRQGERFFPRDESLLFHVRGIRELLVALVGQLHGVDVPCPVAFGTVHDGASVGADVGEGFFLRSVGEALRRGVVGHCGVEVTVEGESHLFLVVRDIEVGSAIRDSLRLGVVLHVVHDDAYVDFLWIAAWAQRVERAVLRKAKGAVRGDGEVTHGMFLEMRDLFRGRANGAYLIYIHRTALLAQKEITLSVRHPYRIAVFHIVCRQLPVGAVL